MADITDMIMQYSQQYKSPITAGLEGYLLGRELNRQKTKDELDRRIKNLDIKSKTVGIEKQELERDLLEEEVTEGVSTRSLERQAKREKAVAAIKYTVPLTEAGLLKSQADAQKAGVDATYAAPLYDAQISNIRASINKANQQAETAIQERYKYEKGDTVGTHVNNYWKALAQGDDQSAQIFKSTLTSAVGKAEAEYLLADRELNKIFPDLPLNDIETSIDILKQQAEQNPTDPRIQDRLNYLYQQREKQVQIVGRTSEDVNIEGTRDLDHLISQKDSRVEAILSMERVLDIIQEDPARAGIVGGVRRVGQVLTGTMGDVSDYFGEAAPQIKRFNEAADRMIANDLANGRMDSDTYNFLNDPNLGVVQQMENKMAYFIAGVRKEGGRPPAVQDVQNAMKEAKITGFTFSSDVINKYRELLAEQRRSLDNIEDRISRRRNELPPRVSGQVEQLNQTYKYTPTEKAKYLDMINRTKQDPNNANASDQEILKALQDAGLVPNDFTP